jgi:hypothetical protein
MLPPIAGKPLIAWNLAFPESYQWLCGSTDGLRPVAPHPPKWRITASAKPLQLTGSTGGSISRARS